MIITTAIIKGGTGKSTTAAILAQAGVKEGKSVLVIDLDPQGNLTFSVGGRADLDGAFEMLEGKSADYIQQTPQGVDCISAKASLSQIQTGHSKARRLEAVLDKLQSKYDLIIIDTPPAIGELTYNALQCTEWLLLPMETDASSLQGMMKTLALAQQFAKSNKKLKVLGGFVAKYTGRSKINQQMRANIQTQLEHLGLNYLGEVRQSVAVREASILKKNLFDYAPANNATKDYKELYEKIKEVINNG